MTNLERFLKHNVEKYLFGDLSRITEIEEPGVGYPVIMAAFSGIELFGTLLSSVPFNPREGRKRFVDYWSTHLYPTLPSSNTLADTLYRLVRNGIAHTFITHGPIGIVARGSSPHLKFDASGMFIINAEELVKDLSASYHREVSAHITPTGTGAVETKMSRNLTAMLTHSCKVAKKLRQSMPAATMQTVCVASATAISSSAAPSGPSGPFTTNP